MFGVRTGHFLDSFLHFQNAVSVTSTTKGWVFGLQSLEVGLGCPDPRGISGKQ